MSRVPIIISLVFFGLTLIFFYRVFFNLLPIPSDLLVGGYYPWLDYKWGYTVGVPVKNPALSDVLSFAYPLRELAIDLIKKGEVPLWNPYVFSGAPLLANWQSAPLYPLNILMIFLKNYWGWTLMIILQPLLSLFFMFLLLRSFKLSVIPSIFGSIIFAFGGFMLIFWELNFLQAGVWLPLLILSIENFIQKRSLIWLIIIPLTIFTTLTAGNFQISLYSLIIASVYLITRIYSLHLKNGSLLIVKIFIFILLGIGLASIQLAPTYELFRFSIREIDSNIVQQNFGLIPLKNIVTFLSPDFFGNPATFNFRGFLYHETAGYFGIIPLMFVLYAIAKGKVFISSFFILTFFVSLFLVIDNFFGRLVFELKIPLISTSYASRALFILTFSAAILAANGMDLICKSKEFFTKVSLSILVILVSLALGVLFSIKFLELNNLSGGSAFNNLSVSLRNLILPISIALFSFLIFKYIKIIKLSLILLILITIFDLFRFGWKYNPFVSSDLIYPNTPIINFLTENSSLFRVEREKSEVLPPNTWMAYRLFSPSGYDPLVLKPYAQFHNVYNGNSPLGGVSRYLELGKYESSILDLLGVKYLVVAKRRDGRISQEQGFVSVSDPKFIKVFEDKSLIVLENTKVLPRVMLFDSYEVSENYMEALQKLYQGFNFKDKLIIDKEIDIPLGKSENDRAEIVSYQANQVDINTQTKNDSILMLSDAYYPGWEVYINGNPAQLLLADGIFRAVVVPAGKSSVKFIFNPVSFKIGTLLTGASLFLLLFLIILMRFKKND